MTQLFPPPRRNFSPWYQVVSRLMETEQDDALPVDDLSAFGPWRDRLAARLEDALAPWPEQVALDLEVTEQTASDAYTRSRALLDTEDTMSVPAYLPVP